MDINHLRQELQRNDQLSQIVTKADWQYLQENYADMRLNIIDVHDFADSLRQRLAMANYGKDSVSAWLGLRSDVSGRFYYNKVIPSNVPCLRTCFIPSLISLGFQPGHLR
jgi:hypothetical protein